MSANAQKRTRRRAHKILKREGRPQGKDRKHWNETGRQLKQEEGGPAPAAEPRSDSGQPTSEINASEISEGEGNRTAAKVYNRATQRFVKSDQVAKKAREAPQAVEGSENDELDEVELIGKRHSHGEDPAISGQTPPENRRKH
jgi:hypothetical protein